MRTSLDHGRVEPHPPAQDSNVLCVAEPGEVLLVAFSGHWGRLAVPVFEFGRSIAGLPTGRLLLREPNNVWYHRGLPEAGSDIAAVRDLLERKIAALRPRAIVGLGASAGGYAALLFGALLGFDEVHAFTPQTTLQRWHRLRMRDFRWRKDFRRLYASGGTRELFDLRRVLSAGESRTTFNVHYCRHERTDVLHAERLGDIPNVVLHSYGAGGHRLANWLYKRGDLLRLLENAVRR
jgi:hypothetical protein